MIATLDQWIRSHTLERFGPVRSVEQVHVFELAYEAIQRSSRHKSGVAVRFPRILRWRTDLAIRDADKLDDLRRLAMGCVRASRGGGSLQPAPRRRGRSKAPSPACRGGLGWDAFDFTANACPLPTSPCKQGGACRAT